MSAGLSWGNKKATPDTGPLRNKVGREVTVGEQ